MQSHEFSVPEKYIGRVLISTSLFASYSLILSEYKVLKSNYDVIEDKPTTEFSLQFAPKWIVEKAISTEVTNYKFLNSYEIDFDYSPTEGNNILFRHHFQIRHDKEAGKLKLKCRLVSQKKLQYKKVCCPGRLVNSTAPSNTLSSFFAFNYYNQTCLALRWKRVSPCWKPFRKNLRLPFKRVCRLM